MNSTGVIRRISVLMLLCGSLAAGMLWCQIPNSQAADQEDGALAKFMRKKLAASSLVLEGLAVEDAELIQQGAQSMSEMSKSEIWQVLLDEDYREFNREFQASMRKLDQAAKDQNFDRALLEWMDGVKSCVECHKYVRGQRPKLKN